MNIDTFLDIEKEYNLYELSINGVNYWNYCRFTIWNEQIVASKLALSTAHIVKKNNLFSKLGKLFKYRSSRDISGKDILILNHPRRVLNNGVYECIYTDELAKNLDSYVFWEESANMNHMYPVPSSPIIYSDYAEMICGYYLMLKMKRCKKEYVALKNEIAPKIDEVISRLENVYDWQCDRDSLYRLFIVTIWKINFLRPRFEKVINRIKPRLVLSVVGYSNVHMLICEIARRHGIKVAELQHGTMDALHAGYHYAEVGGIDQFADYFLTYSDYWSKQLSIPIKSDNIISVGFPYFERKVMEIRKKYVGKSDALLFISQGAYGKQLSQFAVSISKDERFRDIDVIYKLHPGEYHEWRQRYSWLADSNIRVIDSNEYSVYDCFAMARVQIGCTSTAIYEGLGFGLRTLILKTKNSVSMAGLIDEGYASYIESVDDIYDALKVDNTYVSADSFWKKDAMDNLISEVSVLLEK